MRSRLFGRLVIVATIAVGAVTVVPANANAQLGFVARASFGDEVDFGVGGGARFDLGSLTVQHGLRGEVTMDYFFPDGSDYWELNGDVFLDLATVPGLYVGTGINYGKFSSDADCGSICDLEGNLIDYDSNNTKVGLNLIGGYTFPGARAPFVQAKVELGGGEQLVISAGIRF
jgi:hypothetical protein